MIDEDNSVNMENADAAATPRGKGYHHGDLRAAVIAAGMKRLTEGGDAELGLRALARDVGVSATALYRHFPDKEALLDALADEGLRRLGALQAQAWLKAGGGKAGFRAPPGDAGDFRFDSHFSALLGRGFVPVSPA